MKDSKDQLCERADELISLLYDELGEKDAREFNRHLQECAQCETEFAGFSQIHESIVSWRDETLGVAWTRAAINGRNLASAPVQSGAYVRPSAFAAIREFFNLSPLWMKSAVAFATLVFCVSAIVAVTHLLEKPKVISQTTTGESSEQLKARVAALQAELADVKAVKKEDQTATVAVPSVPSPQKSVKRNEFVAAAGTVKVHNLRKPLSRLERQELAADLRLLASRDDDDLDLVTDTINRAP